MLSERYIELVKSALLNELYIELEAQLLLSVLCGAENAVLDLPDFWATRKDEGLLEALREAKQEGDTVILETGVTQGRPFADDTLRNYTEFSYTLVGRRRLDNLQACVEQILTDGVQGDFLEAGVWRGGCCIFMRALLAAHGCEDRTIWVCDSFQGLPESKLEEDKPFKMSADRLPFLAVTAAEVRENFKRFNLLDEQVKFVPGWFSESLERAPVEQLALLRIDADLYESTMDVLTRMYDKVSIGGWVIIDDYEILPPCKAAVDAFRREHGITEKIQKIDQHAVCWQVVSQTGNFAGGPDGRKS